MKPIALDLSGRDKRSQAAPRNMKYVVFAQAKSGTTWLQKLLSAHPNVHCSESRLFGDFYSGDNPTGPAITVEKFVSTMMRHYHVPPAAEDSATENFERSMLFNIIDAIGQTAMTHSGKRVYGEKLTPYPRTAAACIRTLHEYNPDLCFIHLIRDGRDVIVSGYSHWANIRISAAKAAGKHDDAAKLQRDLDARRVPDKLVDDATRNWVENVAAGLDGEELFANSLRLKYERLTGAAPSSFSPLFTAIGADSSPDVVSAAVEHASFKNLSGGRTAGEEDRGSFFRKGVAGDWPDWLTPEQAARFEAHAGDLMDRLGYARSTPAAAIDSSRVNTSPRKSGLAGTSPRRP